MYVISHIVLLPNISGKQCIESKAWVGWHGIPSVPHPPNKQQFLYMTKPQIESNWVDGHIIFLTALLRYNWYTIVLVKVLQRNRTSRIQIHRKRFIMSDWLTQLCRLKRPICKLEARKAGSLVAVQAQTPEKCGGRGNSHPHWWGWFSLLSLSVQKLIFSLRETLSQTHPEIMFYQLSRHPLAQ